MALMFGRYVHANAFMLRPLTRSFIPLLCVCLTVTFTPPHFMQSIAPIQGVAATERSHAFLKKTPL
jgi:hypothetical protein